MAWTLHQSTTLASATSTVTFNNIPSTGKDLVLWVSARGNSTVDGLIMSLNSSTTNFTRIHIVNDAGTLSSNTGSNSTFNFTVNDGNNSTASTFSNATFYFANYADATNKLFQIDSVIESNTTNAQSGQRFHSATWADTTAISSISVTPTFGNFSTASSFHLYIIS